MMSFGLSWYPLSLILVSGFLAADLTVSKLLVTVLNPTVNALPWSVSLVNAKSNLVTVCLGYLFVVNFQILVNFEISKSSGFCCSWNIITCTSPLYFLQMNSGDQAELGHFDNFGVWNPCLRCKRTHGWRPDRGKISALERLISLLYWWKRYN